jgi:hypothetical protein
VFGAVLLFLIVWVVATLVLSRLRWFRRRQTLAARLKPYVDGGDPTQEIEDWLRQRATPD